MRLRCEATAQFRAASIAVSASSESSGRPHPWFAGPTHSRGVAVAAPSVGVEPEHVGSVRFVPGDGAFDFLAMGAVAAPGVGEVFGVERGVAAKDVGFAEAKLAGAGECPDGDACAADAGFAAADGGVAIHAGEALAEIARDDLQAGQLFPPVSWRTGVRRARRGDIPVALSAAAALPELALRGGSVGDRNVATPCSACLDAL